MYFSSPSPLGTNHIYPISPNHIVHTVIKKTIQNKHENIKQLCTEVKIIYAKGQVLLCEVFIMQSIYARQSHHELTVHQRTLDLCSWEM